MPALAQREVDRDPGQPGGGILRLVGGPQPAVQSQERLRHEVGGELRIPKPAIDDPLEAEAMVDVELDEAVVRMHGA